MKRIHIRGMIARALGAVLALMKGAREKAASARRAHLRLPRAGETQRTEPSAQSAERHVGSAFAGALASLASASTRRKGTAAAGTGPDSGQKGWGGSPG